MRVFISQSMKGKTREEIDADRAIACELLEMAGHMVEGGYVDVPPNTRNEALWCLGESLKILSRCDVLLYIGEHDRNTKLPRGCEVEIHCAGVYGIPVCYGEKGLQQLCSAGSGEHVMDADIADGKICGNR